MGVEIPQDAVAGKRGNRHPSSGRMNSAIHRIAKHVTWDELRSILECCGISYTRIPLDAKLF